MKILVITPKYYPDNYSIIHIVDELKNKGNQVDVLTTTPFDAKGKYLPNYIDKNSEVFKGVNVFRVKAYPRGITFKSLIFNYLSTVNKLCKWVRNTKDRYDAVYTFNLSPVTVLKAGNIYSKKFKVPHIVHVLDLWPISVEATGYTSNKSLFYKYLTHISKKLYNGATTLLIGSPSFEDYLKNVLKINKNMKYVPQPALVGKESHNFIFKEGINILYAGNLAKLQMIHYLIPALDETKIMNINIHFVGSGKERDALLNQAHSSSHRYHIYFHDRLSYEELSDYYYSSDIVFVGLNNKTVVGNTIPNKLITALYYSKPVLAMLNGDGKSIIENTGGGFIINQDISSLKEALINLSKIDKKDLINMGLNNKKYYNEHFSVEMIVKEILSSFSRK